MDKIKVSHVTFSRIYVLLIVSASVAHYDNLSCAYYSTTKGSHFVQTKFFISPVVSELMEKLANLLMQFSVPS